MLIRDVWVCVCVSVCARTWIARRYEIDVPNAVKCDPAKSMRANQKTHAHRHKHTNTHPPTHTSRLYRPTQVQDADADNCASTLSRMERRHSSALSCEVACFLGLCLLSVTSNGRIVRKMMHLTSASTYTYSVVCRLVWLYTQHDPNLGVRVSHTLIVTIIMIIHWYYFIIRREKGVFFYFLFCQRNISDAVFAGNNQ